MDGVVDNMMNFKEYFQLYLEGFETPDNFLLNPENNHKLLNDLETEFISQGGTVLGEGSYGKVYFHPKWNYVLKTFTNDTCYLRFARYSFRNKSPNLPVFYGPPRRIVPNFSRAWSIDKVYVVKMEKLTPLAMDHNAKAKYNEFMQLRSSNDVGYDNSPDTDPKAQAIYNTYMKMREEINLDKCCFDLHGENVMVRPSTGDLVITDPYAEMGDLSDGKNIIRKFAYTRHDIEGQFKRAGNNLDKEFMRNTRDARALPFKNLIVAGGKRTPAKHKKKAMALYKDSY
jgi:hypothetical protein